MDYICNHCIFKVYFKKKNKSFHDIKRSIMDKTYSHRDEIKQSYEKTK